MIACCAFIAASTFFAKMLGTGEFGDPMHPFQIVLGRYVFALLALAPFFVLTRQNFRNAPWPRYVGRSVCGWGGVAGLFAAASLIPLADATAISFLNPIFAMILAIIFLGERVGPIRWGAAAIAMTGGMILIRPGVEAVQIGAVIALAAAFSMAAEIIFAKLLARTEGVVRMLFITNMFATVIAIITASFVWRPPSWEELGLMAAVGWTMVSAQFLFMATLKTADASFATPFFYATLVFAAAYDFAWFNVIPAPISFVGASLIVAGAVLLAIREAQKARSPLPVPPQGGA